MLMAIAADVLLYRIHFHPFNELVAVATLVLVIHLVKVEALKLELPCTRRR